MILYPPPVNSAQAAGMARMKRTRIDAVGWEADTDEWLEWPGASSPVDINRGKRGSGGGEDLP